MGSRGGGPLSSVVVVVTPPALTKTYPTTTHHGGTTSNPLRVPWRGTSSITKPLSKSTAVGAETHSYSCRLSTKSHCKTAFQKKREKKKASENVHKTGSRKGDTARRYGEVWGNGAALGTANRRGYQTGPGPQADQNPSHAGKEVLQELISKRYKHSHLVTRES